MCGIAGFLEADPTSDADVLHRLALGMADALHHRGPDDRGAWVDARRGVALGHRRLSIVDLSPEGAQPMASRCGRYAIAYNGEVYNFRELRSELEAAGHDFRGHSDTEVLVEAISEWGVRDTLARANGMFAFALWDARDESLVLARDRIGKKPLYYGWCGRRFFFGSELKALRAHPDFRSEIDRDALGLLVRYGYIPAPWSILRNVRKLEAGHVATLPRAGGVRDPRLDCYWSRRDVAEAGLSNPFPGTPEDAVEELDQLLRDAVARRMVADVDLGALLSGGFDSSTVVALMQVQSDRPVRTFSVGYREEAFDEARHARAVAMHLGTDHHELTVTPDDTLAVIPELPRVFDEPFADVSQIPTLLVSRLARTEVTVALSGDGGDELFAGYNRYDSSLRRWRRYAPAPRPLRRAAAGVALALARASRPSSARAAGSAGRVAPWRARLGRLEREASLLDVEGAVEFFARKSTYCPSASEFVLEARDPQTVFSDRARWARLPDEIERMMFLDFSAYLQEDVLMKVDRASMAASLEVRCPLLDHRVVELAWRLPLSMKRVGSERKWVLRQVLDRYVPRALTDRPKMGFGVPVKAWLAGPLRGWAESLLAEDRLRAQGLFHPAAVRAVWTQHTSGWRRWHALLWNILMFQAWLDEWSGSSEAPTDLRTPAGAQEGRNG